MLRLGSTRLFVVDCTDPDDALRFISRLMQEKPPPEVIAVCDEDVKILSALLRAGVREYVPFDASIGAVRERLALSIEKACSVPAEAAGGGSIVAYLPGKPGSGASTIAANVSLIAANFQDRSVLLIDLDREAPMQAFLHRLHPEHFLQEALGISFNLDKDIWSRLLSQRGPLDLLPADADGASFENGRTQHLLDFVRRSYDLTCVDLPGTLDPCSVEVLLESRRIYLVCTQELASIHTTIRKADRLRRFGIDKELRLVINRYNPKDVMTSERIADLAGLTVETTIPNSYQLANSAVERGTQVDLSSPLGKAYANLVRLQSGNAKVAIPRKRKRFLEFLYQPFLRANRGTA
jgi:Flp pilus assembly CpaE family ATPase